MKDGDKEETIAAPPTSGRSGMLRTVLVTTLAFVGVSLGLVAWNTQHAQDTDELRLVQRDALIAGQQLNAAASRAEAALRTKMESGTSLSRIRGSDIGVESLMTLSQAEQSADQRNRALAQQARALMEKGERFAVADGQLLMVLSPGSGQTAIARAAPDEWLPNLPTFQRVILTGGETLTLGGRQIVPPSREIIESGRGFQYTRTLQRSATACSPVRGASFSICLNRDSPLLTLENGVQLLMFLLLLAAPSLVVFGLYSSLAASQPTAVPVIRPKKPDTSFAGKAASSGGVGIWEINLQADAARIDEEAARLFGLQFAGEVTASEILSKVYDKHIGALRNAMETLRPGQSFAVSVGTAASRADSWIELRGSQTAGDGPQNAAYSGVVFDVTESVRERERQKSSETRLRKAIESFPCPFALWDNKKRLTFWNKAFGQIFGLDEVLRPGVGHETVMLARSGNVITERATEDDPNVTLVGLRSGEWYKVVERRTAAGGLITFGLDVTQDVKSEEELTQQKKKLRAAVQELARSEGHNAELARKYNEEKAKAERSADSKSAFLANMSHELRTPLNAINGFSEILVNEMYGPLGDRRYHEYAHDILTSGQHLLDMINDILDIAKIEAGKMTIAPKPIDLVDPVDAAVRMIRRKAEEKGIALNLQAADDLPEVDADHRAVRQMVLNLLSNAIKFTDAGGRILVAVQLKGEFVRVAVRDSGVGISKEHLPRLAQPFEQVQETRERNHDGTGLGLALTKSFAEMHGGHFSIASEVGKGTMVSFYLPVSKDLTHSDRNVA